MVSSEAKVVNLVVDKGSFLFEGGEWLGSSASENGTDGEVYRVNQLDWIMCVMYWNFYRLFSIALEATAVVCARFGG